MEDNKYLVIDIFYQGIVVCNKNNIYFLSQYNSNEPPKMVGGSLEQGTQVVLTPFGKYYLVSKTVNQSMIDEWTIYLDGKGPDDKVERKKIRLYDEITLEKLNPLGNE